MDIDKSRSSKTSWPRREEVFFKTQTVLRIRELVEVVRGDT